MSECSDLKTLVIKHLPAECTEEECNQFLTSLGATSVTFMGHNGPLKHCAFAEFTSNEHAWKIVGGLHQKTVFGRRLTVEFCCKDLRTPFIQLTETSPSSRVVNDDSQKVSKHCFLSEFTPNWDRSIHVPSNLVYQYPPPTDKILTNIVRTLVSCSAFYTQVLHLMNRMHLPPPFDDPDLFPGTYVVISDRDKMNNALYRADSDVKVSTDASIDGNSEVQEMDLSSGPESELDSDETEKVQRKRSIPKRRRIRTSLPVIRLPNAPKTRSEKSSATKTVTEIGDLFERTSKPKKTNLHIPQAIKLINPSHENPETLNTEGGFGIIEPPIEICEKEYPSQLLEQIRLRKSPHRKSESSPHSHRKITKSPQANSSNPIDQSSDINNITTFSLNELREGCLTPEDRNNYTVFSRGYNPGEPTSRLYVKNLATSVQESDLFKIYGLFANGVVLNSNEKLQLPPESSLRFSIRLLTEGRMKGQAFISLPCESTAKQALEMTNGFMLYDKPMVVQFARGAKAKVDDKSLILSQSES